MITNEKKCFTEILPLIKLCLTYQHKKAKRNTIPEYDLDLDEWRKKKDNNKS